MLFRSVHLSAMDGIAVRAADLAGASEVSPVELDAGRRPGDGGFAWIDTGQPMPVGFDAVVMVERVEPMAGAGAAQTQGARRGHMGA